MEETLYDTSEIIEIVARLRRRIPGYVSILSIIEYPPVLEYASKILYPKVKDYHLALKWQTILRRKGSILPAVDLVIAAQAYNNNLTLITRDKHFEILKREAVPDLKLLVLGKKE